MLPYVATFSGSVLFCTLGDRYRRVSNIYYALAVLCVSILAGVRDYSIGSDVMTYGHWLFQEARETADLFAFIQADTAQIEPLYLTFTWIVARLFRNEHWLYFFIGLFIYSLVMSTLVHFREYISVSMAWLAYLLLFYGDTYNGLRQSMAVALTFYAFTLLVKRQYLQYIVAMIAAFFFHNTALIALAVLMVWWLLKWQNRLWLKFSIIAVVMVAVVTYRPLLGALISVGVLPDKMVRYYITSGGLSLNPVLIRLPYLILIALFYWPFVRDRSGAKVSMDNKLVADFLVMIMTLEMITASMRGINATLYRISWYFGMYRCVAVGRVCTATMRDNQRILRVFIAALLTVTWIYQIVIQGNNAIYPFVFNIQPYYN